MLSADALDRGYAIGNGRWPGTAFTRAQFSDFVSNCERRRLEMGLVEPVADERFSDLFLAGACATGDPVAIAHFDRELLDPDVRHAVARNSGRDTPAADELRQATRERLLVPSSEGRVRIAEYLGRGDLRSWVRVSVARLLTNLASRRPPETPVEEQVLEILIGDGGNPELAYMKRIYKNEFRAAFRDALASLEPRSRTVLRYAFVDRLSVDALGALYGIHRATAARWLRTSHEALGRATRALLTERLGVTSEELSSVLALIQSGLDVSLERLLGEEPP